ncbi:MAG: methyltransferase domain-containing protein [Herpetosiphon sp.]
MVQWLQCPRCAYGELRLVTAERGDEIDVGTLDCQRCGYRMPVRDGIVDALDQAPVAMTPAQIVNRLPVAALGYEPTWRWQSLSLLSGERFPLQRELALVARLLEPERGGVFVDVACSVGLYARSWSQLAPPEAVLIGVDHSRAMLTQARRRMATLERPVTLIRAAAQALPLRPGVVRGVGMGGSLNEIGDAAAALREIRRVLRPDGRFVTMNLVAAQSSWGKLLQQFMSSGGIAFPTLAAFNEQLEQAELQRWAQWVWRVVAITACRVEPGV